MSRIAILPVLAILIFCVHCERIAFNFESRKIYEDAVLGPMYAYNDAIRAYLNGNYLGASFKFGLVYNQYPKFYLNDKTLFFMGSSLLNLGLPEVADSLFRIGCSSKFIEKYHDLQLFGRIKVAIAQNNTDSLRTYITIFMQKHSGSNRINDVRMCDAIVHLRTGDTVYAEPLFLSLGTDSSNIFLNQVSLAYLASISLHRGDGKKAKSYLQNAVQILRKTDKSYASFLFSSGIYPLVIRDRTLVINYCENLDEIGAFPKPSEQDQNNLLMYILDYPAPDDFKEEKKALIAKLGMDTRQKAIDKRIKVLDKVWIRGLIAHIDSVCYQLDSKKQ